MATKDFIYDLTEGLEKNGDDYILLIPTNFKDKEGKSAINYAIRYNFDREDSTPIEALVGASQMLQIEAKSIADENGVDFDEYMGDFYDDDDDEEEYFN